MDFARIQGTDFGYPGSDFGCSPYKGDSTMHLPSPSHRHNYGMEIPSSIQELRRTLSRSPSKPTRFHLRRSDSSRSPISPLALARAFSPKDTSPVANHTEAAFSPPHAAAPKKRTVRRLPGFRSSPRTRAKSKSPRRVLADSTDHGNATPATARRSSGEENVAAPQTSEYNDQPMTDQRHSMRFGLDDKPIKLKLAFSRSRLDLTTPSAPAKSSPLKRSDGLMNLDAANPCSPVAKRRSMHGASTFGGPGFDIFDHGPTSRTSGEEPSRPQEPQTDMFNFSTPVSQKQLPLRKTPSLRKSTLDQRYSSPRPKPSYDSEFAMPGLAASKTRQRMSLDSSFGFGSSTSQTPAREPTRQHSFGRSSGANHMPHPLSHALTPSSSTSWMADESIPDAPAAPPRAISRHPLYSRSLPIGASRPTEPEHSAESTFETPLAFKMARPDPSAFMSTGLLSKKNRNVDEGASQYVMPGTPSKRNSFPPVSPRTTRRNPFEGKLSRPEFGQPSTPFNAHPKSSSTKSFGKGVSIFGSMNAKPERRYSFASIDGDENSHSPCGKNNSPIATPPGSTGNSPCGNRMADSQSSCDDMPPTPTKPNGGSGRRKDTSLRRQAIKPGRASLGSDTFTAPPRPETPSFGFRASNVMTPFKPPPHTPNESFTPPDASRLSISGGQRRGSPAFNNSTNSNPFSPATPTTPREHTNYFANGPDFDPSLSKRFDTVAVWGNGEFSTVYRAEKKAPGLSFSSTPPSQVWAVKKTKKPYLGQSDREKKMQEVRILQALRGHEHIVHLEDHWEHNGHLFIQTEFCEEGNLQRFLTIAGNKSRLDDFRIWKILLEISSGVKHIHDNGYIHLDLKPANILITFDGVLKIADFGLANPWPAARHIDGEGDRHYLAPEALQGRYDKPGDVFALGTMMLEIAGNIVIPDGGVSWQRLRTGDFSDIPSLTWSEASSLDRDVHGEPIDTGMGQSSMESPFASGRKDDPLELLSIPTVARYSGGLACPPRFMIEEQNPDSLHQLIKWMMSSNPDTRPTIDQVFRCYGCQWVEQRARAGATIFEGNWGPADDVLEHHDIHDADMMDMS